MGREGGSGHLESPPERMKEHVKRRKEKPGRGKAWFKKDCGEGANKRRHPGRAEAFEKTVEKKGVQKKTR